MDGAGWLGGTGDLFRPLLSFLCFELGLHRGSKGSDKGERCAPPEIPLSRIAPHPSIPPARE